MSEEEVKQNLISTYVLLLRIKAASKEENEVLESELVITKIRLSSYNIDIAAIEKALLKTSE